jgi:O-methyltransferase
MIPKNVFIGNLELVQQFKSVEGCVVECGVWRGGMISAMAKLLGNKRKYYLFDSFEGLPPAGKIDGESALRWQKDKNSPLYFNNCRAEEKYAQEAMTLSGVKNYKIIRGWFFKTLPENKFNHNIAILRLDADWYKPTMECLTALYNHVVKGGIIIVDDYYTWDGCARAVHEFILKKEDAPRLYQSQKGVCYILKR